MPKLKNKGECLECGRYFYESAYQDICPSCIEYIERMSGEAEPEECKDEDGSEYHPSER